MELSLRPENYILGGSIPIPWGDSVPSHLDRHGPVHCRISISGLYPSDINRGPSSAVTTQNVSRYCPQLRTTALDNEIVELFQPSKVKNHLKQIKRVTLNEAIFRWSPTLILKRFFWGEINSYARG